MCKFNSYFQNILYYMYIHMLQLFLLEFHEFHKIIH
jgi:hypothetical protein